MAERVAACVWMLTPELLVALDERFGPPTDAYVNGSQVWLRSDGPGGVRLEWRLHPVAGFQRPAGVATFDLLETVVWAVRTGEAPPAEPSELWDGLEVFACDGDEIEPRPLATAATEALGLAPDHVGTVDHDQIGDTWERTAGGVSIVAALVEQLENPSF